MVNKFTMRILVPVNLQRVVLLSRSAQESTFYILFTIVDFVVMTDFVETTGTADREKVGAGGESTQQTVLIDFASPVRVRYCGVCSMPPEFCEFGSCFDKCLPWIADNCPDVLSEDVLATMVGKVSVREEGDETQQVWLIGYIGEAK